jgi:hypothetical protein
LIKKGVLAIFKFKKSAGNHPFLALFLYISGDVGDYLPPLTLSNTTPCPGTSLPIVGAPSSF